MQAHTLLSAVVQYSASDPDDFVLLTAISDSRGFNELPSWEQPQYIQDRCYVGAPFDSTSLRSLSVILSA